MVVSIKAVENWMGNNTAWVLGVNRLQNRHNMKPVACRRESILAPPSSKDYGQVRREEWDQIEPPLSCKNMLSCTDMKIPDLFLWQRTQSSRLKNIFCILPKYVSSDLVTFNSPCFFCFLFFKKDPEVKFIPSGKTPKVNKIGATVWVQLQVGLWKKIKEPLTVLEEGLSTGQLI